MDLKFLCIVDPAWRQEDEVRFGRIDSFSNLEKIYEIIFII